MVKKTAFTLFLVIVWEIVVQLKLFHASLMPSVIEIIGVFIEDFDLIAMSTLYSLLIIILAFLITSVVIVLMLLFGRFQVLEDFFDYLNTILHPIPGVALLIIVITWFGIGINGLLFIMVHSMIWPVYNNVLLEMKRIHKDYHRIVFTFNLSKGKQIFKVYLPGIAPGLISGLKTAWSRGWRAFISAEMILGMAQKHMGLGRYLFEKRIFMNIPGQYAGLLAIIIVSLLIEHIGFDYLEKKTIKKWAI